MSHILSDKWRLVLYPTTAEIMGMLNSIIDINQFGYQSRAMGVESEGTIASISRPRQRHPFEFVLAFEAPVWITLFITMLLIPLSFCVIEKTFSGYFRNLWNYSYLILSEAIPKMPKSSMKRFVLTFWLLACTVLLSAYSGVIRDQFIRANPDVVIDSWEDLYDQKDMKIVTIEGSDIHHFVLDNQNNNEMARDFASRLEIIKYESLDFYEHTSLFCEKLYNGYAVSYLKNLLVSCRNFGEKDNITNSLWEKVHFSSSVTSPYFLLVSKLMVNKDAQALNNL